MKFISVNDIKITIGSNQNDNDVLFDLAEDNDLWFHVNNLPSAHLWVKFTDFDKNTLYRIALELKKNSKYKKYNNISVIYAPKSSLKKTDKLGCIQIVGKSKKIKV